MTTIELLREENKSLSRENELLKQKLNSKQKKHPAPLALRVLAWFTVVVCTMAIILITVNAFTG